MTEILSRFPNDKFEITIFGDQGTKDTFIYASFSYLFIYNGTSRHFTHFNILPLFNSKLFSSKTLSHGPYVSVS